MDGRMEGHKGTEYSEGLSVGLLRSPVLGSDLYHCSWLWGALYEAVKSIYETKFFHRK